MKTTPATVRALDLDVTLSTWEHGEDSQEPRLTLDLGKGATLVVGMLTSRPGRFWARLDGFSAGRGVTIRMHADEREPAFSGEYGVWPALNSDHGRRSDQRALTQLQYKAADNALREALLHLRASGHMATLLAADTRWRAEARVLDIDARLAELVQERAALVASLA